MTKGKKIVFGGGRRQDKTLQVQEQTNAEIEAGKKLYLTDAPPIAENDVIGEVRKGT